MNKDIIKPLGLIDDILQCNHHIKHVTSKVLKAIEILYKARKHLDEKLQMDCIIRLYIHI